MIDDYDDYIGYAPGRAISRSELTQSENPELNLTGLLVAITDRADRQEAQRILYSVINLSQEQRDRIGKRLAQLDAITGLW